MPPTFCSVREIDRRQLARSRSDPLEPDDLASAHAGVGGEVQGRVEALGACPLEKYGEFGRSPGASDHLGGTSAAALGGVGDVAVEQLALDGELERGTHDHVHFVDSLGGEPAAMAASSGSEVLVEAVEVVRAESAQRHFADRRVDVALDEP